MDVLSESLEPQQQTPVPLKHKLMQVWWAAVLAVTLLTTMSLSWIVHKLPGLTLTKKEQITCQICHYLFLLALRCVPWIQWRFEGPMDWKAVYQSANGRGAFLMLNHTSFLDGIWASAFLPGFGIANTRTLMKSSLFKIPVFGAISRMAGHFGVYFTSTKSGDFSVDREAQAAVNAKVLAHVQAGGSLGLFPEGQINAEPRKLQTFRRGAFNYVKDHGLCVWSLLATGADKSWPKSSPLGGFPTKMTVTLFPVFTEDEVAKLSVAELCEQAQVRMQAQLDRLYAMEDAAEKAQASGDKKSVVDSAADAADSADVAAEAVGPRSEEKEAGQPESEVRQRKVRDL